MTNAYLFRAHARIEDAMLRSVMPRTAEREGAEPAVVTVPGTRAVVAERAGSRLVRPLTFTLAEVASV